MQKYLGDSIDIISYQGACEGFGYQLNKLPVMVVQQVPVPIIMFGIKDT